MESGTFIRGGEGHHDPREDERECVRDIVIAECVADRTELEDWSGE
jgi:hypothetical protein